MTPNGAQLDARSSLLLVAAIVGAGAGFMFGGGSMWLYGKWQMGLARKGWTLVPVVIAARDLTPGTVVTMADLDQRSIPEQFETASVIKPDSASYVVNQAVNVPVAKGEPLRWGYFSAWEEPLDSRKDAAVIDACSRVAATRFSAAPQRIDQLRARLEKEKAP